MRLAVNPNRMELLKLKKRRVLAQRGHDLLEDKLDELLRRFMAMIKEVIELEGKMADLVKRQIQRFSLCFALVDRKRLDRVLSECKSDLEIELHTEQIMNLKIPRFKIKDHNLDINYFDLPMPLEMDLAREELRENLMLLFDLAGYLKAVQLLSREIESTRRRVNALEYILIPTIAETISYINAKLTELERDNLTRLMRVKEILANT